MLSRYLVSMDLKESQSEPTPFDAVVLLMSCDETAPTLPMGAASCGLPTIGLSGGPMPSGKFHSLDSGSETGIWQMSEKVRSSKTRPEEFFERKAE